VIDIIFECSYLIQLLITVKDRGFIREFDISKDHWFTVMRNQWEDDYRQSLDKNNPFVSYQDAHCCNRLKRAFKPLWEMF